MSSKILMKRGLKADLPTLDIGEFGICTDTKEVFIGTDAGNTIVNGATGSFNKKGITGYQNLIDMPLTIPNGSLGTPNWQLIYNSTGNGDLKLHITDDGMVKIHGMVKLLQKPASPTSIDYFIAKLNLPVFNIGTNYNYQISPYSTMRGTDTVSSYDNDMYQSPVMYWNPETTAVYRRAKLEFSLYSDGYYYLSVHGQDFATMLVNAEVYVNTFAYWKFYDKSYTVQQITNKMRTVDDEDINKVNIITAPDIHSMTFESRVKKGIELVDYAKQIVDIPLVCAGDLINEESLVMGASSSSLITHKNAIRDIVGSLEPNFFWCKGNHDSNGYDSLNLTDYATEDILRKMIIEKQKPTGWEITLPSDTTKTYYYAENATKKMRFVFINTFQNDETVVNGAVTQQPDLQGWINQDQIDWMINDAFNFSSKGADAPNWHTAVFTHIPFNFKSANVAGSEACENGDSAFSILVAFNKGTTATIASTTGSTPYHALTGATADFTAQGAMPLVGVWYGHFHNDQSQVQQGITLISQECFTGFKYNTAWGQISRQVFSNDEIIFDIVTIDKSTKTVTLQRIGNGSDRSFTYS